MGGVGVCYYSVVEVFSLGFGEVEGGELFGIGGVVVWLLFMFTRWVTRLVIMCISCKGVFCFIVNLRYNGCFF